MIDIKKYFLIILVICGGAANLIAQGGSNYSIIGIGDLDLSPSSAYDGLAGTSVAFPLNHAMNPSNPALWSKVTQTRLMTGYRFNQNVIDDNNKNTLFQNNGRLSGISTIFSIDTSMGITAAFGINPYSSVNYWISVPFSVNNGDSYLTGKKSFQGSGGVSIAYLGGSSKIIDDLYIGATAFTTFGVINNVVSTSFDDANYFASANNVDSKFSGVGFRIGLLYEPLEGLNIGVFTEQHSSPAYNKSEIYSSEYYDPNLGYLFNVDTTISNNYSINLPNAYGIGASWLTGKFRIGADYKFYNFKNLNFNEGSKADYRNLQAVSLAVSRLGNQSYSASYLDRVTYNLGVGYKELYYSVQGNDINELYASFGMNMPVIGSSIIDASVTFGSRGSVNNGLVHEYFGRLSIDISIGETWFKPFKREY